MKMMSPERWWQASPRLVALASCVTAGLLLGSSAATAQTAATPTFTKDVAPILQRSCVSCHRAGQSAPMSLQIGRAHV